MRSMSPVTIFSKTGTGWSTDPNAPTVDASSRTLSLADFSSLMLDLAYTKGTAGESAINFGIQISPDGGTSWRYWVDEAGARRSWTFGSTFTGAFNPTYGGQDLGGTKLRIASWTTGASVASTVFTVIATPIVA